MIQEIIKYNEILQNIPTLIEQSPYKKKYIIEKTGMKAPTFYRKLKNLNFSVKEVMNIAKVLKPEEYYLYELKQGLMRGKQDIKEGRIQNHEEVMAELKKQFLK